MKTLLTFVFSLLLLALPASAQLRYQQTNGEMTPIVDIVVGTGGIQYAMAGAVNWNKTFESEWVDANSVSHKITTPKRIGESNGNHAWRHRAYVRSALRNLPPVKGATLNGNKTNTNTTPAMFSSSWTDASGITHTVNTDPEEPNEDPDITAKVHADRVVALLNLFPPK